MLRCQWCTDDPLYVTYHDSEWGVAVYDKSKLFEFLLLEGFQAGLSWITILKKREHYRKVLFEFNANRLAQLTDKEIENLLQDPGIIRNRLKLEAVRKNAKAWLNLENPVEFLWSFVGGQPKINHFSCFEQIPAETEESVQMSKSLKKAGFNFVGPTTCYAYMQSMGMVMDHTINCYRYAQLTNTAEAMYGKN
ncbi:UNVERIFIED_CONTAM: hypothetical protein GTU68_008227 [Idotea baltica]|nr:hypothetical protein [Idotea baltica]